MTRHEMVEGCITEAIKGRPCYLMALLSYLRDVLKIPIERILLIAERHFKIPLPIARETFYLFRPQDTFR